MNTLPSSRSSRGSETLIAALLFLLAIPLSFAATGTISFKYDPASRLAEVNHATGQKIAYQYDSAGNLTNRTVTTLQGDSDNDGMADAWEQQHFQTLARDGTGDYDKDGASDLAEYLAGTEPKNAASVLRLLREVTAQGETVTVQWASVAGKQYRLQYKNSVMDPTWQDTPGNVTASGPLSANTVSMAPGTPNRFYRVILVP